MSERLVAVERAGTLNLYAVNGEGPVLVGMLVVGSLDEYTAAMLGAAFADLRAAATSGPLASAPLDRYTPPDVTPHGIERYLPDPRVTMREALAAVPVPRAPRHRLGAEPDPMSLNGRVRTYLAEHGPSTNAAMLADVAPNATSTKTPKQRLSTALATLLRAGMVQRTGKYGSAVWSLSEKGQRASNRAAPTPPPHGPGATWRRVSGEP
jgi:hypothetical protein